MPRRSPLRAYPKGGGNGVSIRKWRRGHDCGYCYFRGGFVILRISDCQKDKKSKIAWRRVLRMQRLRRGMFRMPGKRRSSCKKE